MANLVLFGAIVIAVLFCSGGKMVADAADIGSIKTVPPSVWKKLSEKRIFFGHQSVGYNIIDGIKELQKDHPEISLRVVETAEARDFDAPLLGHSRTGKNGDPLSKIKEFARFVEETLGNRVDIAFFKLCYVDITSATDVEKLFGDYRQVMFKLRETFPKVTFVHVTVPLTTVQTGWKAWAKRLLGKMPGGVEDNIRRNQFNRIMQREYEGREPIFDLAKAESTFEGGDRLITRGEGVSFFSLVPAYTDDGGHLNQHGRRIVSEELLLVLSRVGG